MTWIEDLAPCTYFDRGPPRSKLIAVGWLGVGRPVPGGSLAPDDRAALDRLLLAPWNPFRYLGSHECDLCPRGDAVIEDANLLVPAPEGDAVYAAPAMIGHYVHAHGYVPPAPFTAAVRACPPIGSTPYLLAMARHRHDSAWCHGLLEAVATDGTPPIELASFLVGAARTKLGELELVMARERKRAELWPSRARPRGEWVAEVGPRIAHAARALGAAGPLAREALDDLQRARGVLTEEPYAGAIAAAIAAIRAA